MKKSKEYSPKVKRLLRSLKKQYKKTSPPEYSDPLDALIYAVLCEKLDDKTANNTLEKFKQNFIDLNDLRVSRSEEIIELINQEPQISKQIAWALTGILNSVFNRYNIISLKSLKKAKKRSARKIIEKFNGITPFAVNYCMLTAIKAHAIPVNEKMVQFLKRKDCLDPDADINEANAFLNRLIPAKDAYEFYALLRRKSETVMKEKKKTTRKTKKKTKRKTKKRKK